MIQILKYKLTLCDPLILLPVPVLWLILTFESPSNALRYLLSLCLSILLVLIKIDSTIANIWTSLIRVIEPINLYTCPPLKSRLNGGKHLLFD